MEVTHVKIQQTFDDPSRIIKAIASITMDKELVIHDVRLLQTADKMFVAMPNKRTGEGIFKDVVHPINEECRNKIETAVISAYDRFIEDQESGETTLE